MVFPASRCMSVSCVSSLIKLKCFPSKRYSLCFLKTAARAGGSTRRFSIMRRLISISSSRAVRSGVRSWSLNSSHVMSLSFSRVCLKVSSLCALKLSSWLLICCLDFVVTYALYSISMMERRGLC